MITYGYAWEKEQTEYEANEAEELCEDEREPVECENKYEHEHGRLVTDPVRCELARVHHAREVDFDTPRKSIHVGGSGAFVENFVETIEKVKCWFGGFLRSKADLHC